MAVNGHANGANGPWPHVRDKRKLEPQGQAAEPLVPTDPTQEEIPHEFS
jgi:hypothetical protein